MAFNGKKKGQPSAFYSTREKMRIRDRCEALMCTNYRPNGSAQQGLSFHKFPRDPHMRRSWVAALSKEGFIPKVWSVVCSEHFKPQDFSKKGFTPRLKQGVVPSIFDFPQDFCEIKERNKTISGMTSKEKPEICIFKTHELLLKAQLLMREIEELLDSSTPTDQTITIQQELQTSTEQDKETLVMEGIRIKSAASGEDLRRLSSQAAGAVRHQWDK